MNMNADRSRNRTGRGSSSLTRSGPVTPKKPLSSRLRVALLNHAYLAEENQKNLWHLASYVDLLTIAPSRLSKPGLGMISRSAHQSDRLNLIFKQPWFLHGQYLLDGFGGELSRYQPDLIHVEYAPWTPISVQTLLLMRRVAPRARFVLTLRKNTYLPGTPPVEVLKVLSRRLVDRCVNAYVVESSMAQQMGAELLGIARSRMHVCLQLGVDVELFSPRGAPRRGGPMVLGFVGELHLRKGIVELVEAVDRVVASGRKVTLRVVGSGPLAAELRARAASAAWLQLAGPVPHREVAEFLRGCDAFAMPSRNEPDHQEHDGHAVMEAMACGLPAIVTKSGVIPDLTADGAGLFVRETHVADLVAAIGSLYDDAEMAASIGRAARAVAQTQFALDVVAARRARVYEEICHG